MKYTVTVSKVERTGSGAIVTVAIAPGPLERGQTATRMAPKIVTIDGLITLAAIRAEVEAALRADLAERAIVGAGFEVDV
jgi:hypothetical protein